MNTRLKAFNLIEILVVLAIIGILISVSAPIYNGIFGKAHAIEAKQHLQQLHGQQKAFRLENFKYSENFEDIKFEAGKSILEQGTAKYEYSIVQANENTFLAKAEAVVDFDGDGIKNVWEINQDGKLREVIAD
ncbi:MAG: type IV pilin protein [Bacteroidota bacterium]